MLPDGRVLFTRWEYIDRDLTFRQSLWTQNPDGTVYQLYLRQHDPRRGHLLAGSAVAGRTDRRGGDLCARITACRTERSA